MQKMNLQNRENINLRQVNLNDYLEIIQLFTIQIGPFFIFIFFEKMLSNKEKSTMGNTDFRDETSRGHHIMLLL